VRRYQWEGIAKKPYITAEARDSGIVLIFNKFGDKTVSHYNIYGGAEPQSDQILTTSSEPYIELRDLENDQTYYYQIVAINSSGRSAPSEIVSAVPIGPVMGERGAILREVWNQVLGNDIASLVALEQFPDHINLLAKFAEVSPQKLSKVFPLADAAKAHTFLSLAIVVRFWLISSLIQ